MPAMGSSLPPSLIAAESPNISVCPVDWGSIQEKQLLILLGCFKSYMAENLQQSIMDSEHANFLLNGSTEVTDSWL